MSDRSYLLPDNILSEINKRDNEIFYSVASVWETTIKYSIKPEQIGVSPDTLVNLCNKADTTWIVVCSMACVNPLVYRRHIGVNPPYEHWEVMQEMSTESLPITDLLVSIIIPVYNVENYLPQCLDSVLAQTYNNLEILLVDDGSTDQSGSICDNYAQKDPRIIVFHTRNKGLSAARNFALSHCHGDYIQFIDSDDWMEKDSIETMVNAVASHHASMAVCGYYNERKKMPSNENRIRYETIFFGDEILQTYLSDFGIGNIVWNKLYKADLFEEIRFPEGRDFEDIATTYKLLDLCHCLVTLDRLLIHYRFRASSIAHTHSLKNLVDHWLAYYERYEALNKRFPEYRSNLITGCMGSIGRFWRWYFPCAKEDPATGQAAINEMQAFAKKCRREVLGDKRYSFLTKFNCFISGYANSIVFLALHGITRGYRLVRRKSFYE